MGALEDAQKQAEEMMKQAQAAAGASSAGAASMAAAQAGTDALWQEAADLDPKDPAFAAIDGVTYDQYVALCVKLQPAGTDSAKQEELAVANGLSKEQWKSVSDAFTKRCVDNPVFARRLGKDVMAGGAS